MVPFKVCEAIKGRVPASSFLRAHFTDKEGRSRNDRSPSHYIPMTDAALTQKLLQKETTLNGLSSEIQKIKEEMMDQDTRDKNSDKLLHEKIKEQAEQIYFSNLKLKLREQETQLPPEVNHDQENVVNKHSTEGPLQAKQVLHGKLSTGTAQKQSRKPLNTRKRS